MPERLTTEERIALHHAAERLESEFAGVIGRDTVDEYLVSSLRHLTAHANIQTFVPLLAERFTRQRLIALARLERQHNDGRRLVVFLDAHNSGRSQMAMTMTDALGGGQVQAWSGGAEPAIDIEAAVADAMIEIGMPLREVFPKPWTAEVLNAADLIVAMGVRPSPDQAGDTPIQFWDVDDPSGRSLEQVRPIRDALRVRVEQLTSNLVAAAR